MGKDISRSEGPKTSMSLQLAQLGLSGEQHFMTIVPFGPTRPVASPEGSPGLYDITMYLQRPGLSLSPEYQIELGQGKARGSSHLAISAPAAKFADERFNTPGTVVKFVVTTDGGARIEFKGIPNNQGYLSHIEAQIWAASFRDAEDTANLTIAPLLSSISVVHDIPLTVAEILIRELASGAVYKGYIAPFPAVAGLIIPLVHPPEARTLFNSYRDALNSTDQSWRFLCFIRILEQLWKWQQPLFEQGAAGAVDLESIVIPNDQDQLRSWLESIFSSLEFDELAINDTVPVEARNLTTNEVILRFLKPIRHEIAHGLFERGVLASDKNDVAHQRDIRKWLPMARCISRVHLKLVFKFPP